MLALTFANKDDYNKVREDDYITIADIQNFQPNVPLTVVLHHLDGKDDKFPANHTFNDLQIKWYKAGSALNVA